MKDLKRCLGTDIDVGTKTTILGIFSFRAVLNLSMLLTESDIAKEVRNRILDILIGIMKEKTGGQSKYINQKDSNYLISAHQAYEGRKEFTNALKEYIDMGNYKYAYFTNKIYK